MIDPDHLRTATRQERAVLAHPDQRSGWVIVIVAELGEPVAPETLEHRLGELSRQEPIVAARLEGAAWRRGTPCSITVDGGAVRTLGTRFELDREPPLRVRLGDAGRTLVLEGHHAAFDGLGLIAALSALTGRESEGDRTAPVLRALPTGAAAAEQPPRSLWSRLTHPADRVAPSRRRDNDETFVSADVDVERGSGFTPRLVTACVNAAVAHNRAHEVVTSRIGVSLGLGGTHAIGNTASYRRVDLDVRSHIDVAAAVRAALAQTQEPAELRFAPRAARMFVRPLLNRFSDSFLVSNLGVVDVPGVRRLAFYPVARGRSAVAFGAASVGGGRSVLTVRARDLDADDAQSLLGRVTEQLSNNETRSRLTAQP